MTSQLPETSNPATDAFHLAGINTVEDFTKWTEKDLLKLHGVGPKVIRMLKEQGVIFKK